MQRAPGSTDDATVIAGLAAAAGAEAVTTDPAVLRRFGTDLHHDGPAPLALVRPSSIDSLCEVVRTATTTIEPWSPVAVG